jgi:RNA polymerase sigma-70 factor (ECF subfamily)
MSQVFDEELIKKCRSGDQEAARLLFELYAERLMTLAKWRVGARLTSRVDPEDILQSVFGTFFRRLREGHFQFQDQDDLLRLLVRITLHKTLKQISYQTAAKRDPHQEVGQEVESNEGLGQVLAREEPPDVAIAFMDQWEAIMRRLGSQERQILEMRMQGFTNEEIAKKLGIYDRKIRRLVEHVRALAVQSGLMPPQA